ncbi:MAG: biopolymer transporter ExbD [Deltaproteobacteria bacterium]|nr:biopolymer transporter ExbD [Deltaproteobacteria bacterium]MDD9827121.1 biopolymer transporter ExbD [Deltaproteobacteria bacterium]MDD9853856.1 biopolymer transporter ExbD [Deltaproteobacteria bacterium]MDD9873742.1 biopolymer transporter ExbD [Deltaproteobacteria bacterium]
MAAALPSDDGDGGGGLIAEINITPLTDVFLVLLIIFMVTSSVIVNTGKKVDLPEAQEASDTPPKAVTVTMATGGIIQVNGEDIRREDLLESLKAALAVAEDKTVILRGDKEIVYGEAVFVLDQAQLAGAGAFGLATTKIKKR